MKWPNYPSSYTRTTTRTQFSQLGDCEERQRHREREAQREAIMLCALKLQVFSVVTNPNYKKYSFPTNIESRRYNDLSFSQRQPLQRFQSLFVVQSQYNATEASEPSISSHYTSTVGSSSLSSLQLTHWNLTNRHILLLQLIASAVLYLFIF